MTSILVAGCGRSSSSEDVDGFSTGPGSAGSSEGTTGLDESGDLSGSPDPTRALCDRLGSASLDLYAGIWGARTANYLPSTWCSYAY